MALQVCIELETAPGSICWIQIPNGDLETAISDFTEGKDYYVAIVTGLKIDGITSFVNNVFHQCDIFKLNNLIVELEEFHHFSSNDIENLAVLNLILEDRNCDVDEVGDILRNEKIYIYRDVNSMGDVAREWLDNTSLWYQQAKESFPDFDKYFDFDSYGEGMLSSGNYLHDKRNKIIVEVYE